MYCRQVSYRRGQPGRIPYRNNRNNAACRPSIYTRSKEPPSRGTTSKASPMCRCMRIGKRRQGQMLPCEIFYLIVYLHGMQLRIRPASFGRHSVEYPVNVPISRIRRGHCIRHIILRIRPCKCPDIIRGPQRMDMGIATQSREQFSFTVDMRENVFVESLFCRHFLMHVFEIGQDIAIVTFQYQTGFIDFEERTSRSLTESSADIGYKIFVGNHTVLDQ